MIIPRESTRVFQVHQHVIVEDPKFKFKSVGEIMSLVTPSGTYMVRRIPGDATTLEELPRYLLSPSPKQRYVHYAKVYQSPGIKLQFPVDMLRYDSAVPANFRLDITDDLTGRIVVTRMTDDEELMVATTSATRAPHIWTPGRWQSFSWEIEHVATQKLT